MTFLELLQAHRKYVPQAKILALDPGETTGIAYFEAGVLKYHDQLKTKEWPAAVHELQQAFHMYVSDYVVCEDYKVYGWKRDEHAWAALHTPQLIGCVRTLCALEMIPLELRMAVDAKTFCTDDKLTLWGMYKPGMRHARDAIRHGCFAYLFSKYPTFQERK